MTLKVMRRPGLIKNPGDIATWSSIQWGGRGGWAWGGAELLEELAQEMRLRDEEEEEEEEEDKTMMEWQ
jgi:hypothetical protein